jgi:hypothetical protein
MRETELAELMFRMAADRGMTPEVAAEELATLVLPTFVDARAFRSAVILALESSLRAQVEERLQSIRRRFDMEPVASPTPRPQPYAMPQQPVTPAPFSSPVTPADGLGGVTDATMADLMPPPEMAAGEATVVEDELPADATMVWTTRHG